MQQATSCRLTRTLRPPMVRQFIHIRTKTQMDIGVAQRDLGAYDVNALRERVLSLDEAIWLDNDFRQQQYDVHRYTHSVVMVFTDGSGWPNLEVRRENGWDHLADLAVPLMHRIIEEHYAPGGSIIRAMAARLQPGGLITPHRDKHPSFHYGHRIHLPLETNPRVRFTIEGRPYAFEVGHAYEINNQKQHSVMNKGDRARIHFIFDYVPPTHLGQSPEPSA